MIYSVEQKNSKGDIGQAVGLEPRSPDSRLLTQASHFHHGDPFIYNLVCASFPGSYT